MGNSQKKVAPRAEKEDEGTWMWVSFTPESRLIIDFTPGVVSILKDFMILIVMTLVPHF